MDAPSQRQASCVNNTTCIESLWISSAISSAISVGNVYTLTWLLVCVSEHLHTYTDPNGTAVGPDSQEVVPTRRTNSGTETPIKSQQEEAEEQANKEQKDEDAPAASKGLEEYAHSCTASLS